MGSEVSQRTNFVLIDYENVQPDSLSALVGGRFKVRTFLGVNQPKLSSAFAAEMQQLGEHAEYIQVPGGGKNAVDFHIAFYIGKEFADDKRAVFHIISKDKGFDPLVNFLKSKGTVAFRHEEILEIPLLRPHHEMTRGEIYDATVKKLVGLKKSKPKTLKTLSSTIHAAFHGQISEKQVTSLVDSLRSRKCIVVDGKKIIYRL